MNFRIVAIVLLCLTVFASGQAAAQMAPGPMKLSVDDIWIVCGVTDTRDFAASGQQGDWATWEIDFEDEAGAPFLKTPIVFVSLYSNSGDVPAVVGQAQYVKKTGFTLAARNSDLTGGLSAKFAWMAIGKGPGSPSKGE
jgi:hypothetical protein